MACDLSELSDEAKAHLAAAIEIISPALGHVTAGAEVVTDLHPAVRMLADPQRWAMVHELSGDAAMVSDGRHGICRNASQLRVLLLRESRALGRNHLPYLRSPFGA
jgi:hypothetical protein